MRAVILKLQTVAACLCLTLSGCSTTGRASWGEDATWHPGWERVKAAAIGAAVDPGTWIPAAGTVLVLATHNDQRLVDYFSTKQPLFGDSERATRRSDDIREQLFRVHAFTMLLTPSGDSPSTWLANKAKGVLVQESALGATRVTTNLLKKNVDRKVPSFTPVRPDHESFPSNHGTEPFAAAALIRRNIEAMPLPEWSRYTLTGAAYLAASEAAWGRVEMNLHYPSDQLASAAIGNFVALFVNDAFMGAGSPRLSLRLGRKTLWAGVELPY